MCDMPSSNDVWSGLLRRHGFRKQNIESEGHVTADDFCRSHPEGRYVIAMYNHVAAIIDGELIDIWDSGNETVLCAWKAHEKNEVRRNAV